METNLFKNRKRSRAGCFLYSLKTEDNRFLTTNSELKDYVKNHYHKKFSETLDIDLNIANTFIKNIKSSIGNSDNEILINLFSKQEVLETLNLCSKKNTTGLDGLSYEFYQMVFDIICNDFTYILNIILDCSAAVPDVFSEAVITLIPKTSNVKQISEFRPITLANTDYKMYMKLLSERFKTINKKCIGIEQTWTQ